MVSADGAYNIPKEDGIKIVRDLFKHIGLNRLRADHYFANLTFSDVSELDSIDLTAAIAVLRYRSPARLLGRKRCTAQAPGCTVPAPTRSLRLPCRLQLQDGVAQSPHADALIAPTL